MVVLGRSRRYVSIDMDAFLGQGCVKCVIFITRAIRLVAQSVVQGSGGIYIPRQQSPEKTPCPTNWSRGVQYQATLQAVSLELHKKLTHYTSIFGEMRNSKK